MAKSTLYFFATRSKDLMLPSVISIDDAPPHALSNELFHRNFSMRSLCFLLTVVQAHLHRRFQHVGIQLCSLRSASVVAEQAPLALSNPALNAVLSIPEPP